MPPTLPKFYKSREFLYMDDSYATNLLTKISSRFKLGSFTCPPEKLTGGALHQIWKITCSNRVYAIKILNSHIAQKTDVRKKYEETEQIASTLQSLIIPAVAALKLDTHFVHHIDEHLFIVYPFVNGKVLSPKQLNQEHVKIIGQIFANIHTCRLHLDLLDSVPHYDVFDNDHWINIIERYNSPHLSALLPTILK
jgi:Ser/Thr protein kinase RdoA (MazF antagonist)